MAPPGRRTFVVASVFLMLVGVLHAAGHFAYRPTDPGVLAIIAALKSQRVPLGLGMAPSMLDLQNALSLTMAGTFVWLGLTGAIVALAGASAKTLRWMTFVSLAGGAALLMLYAHYRIPTTFVSLALVEVMYALSLLRQAMGFQG